MSTPIFLHVYSDGKVWIACDENFVPGKSGASVEAGTLLGVYRVSSQPINQLLFTLSGTVSSNLALPGAGTAGAPNGKSGSDGLRKEIA
jgi:hypothetical protein